MDFTYDLVVIGSGPAGEKGAAQAAYHHKKVAIVERSAFVGGAGINTGTVPSKTLREAALYYSGLRQRGLYGIDYSLRDNLTVANFLHREQLVVDNERAIVKHNIERHNITLIQGEAALQDAHSILVRMPNGEQITLSTAYILIATGSSPFHPPGVPFDDKRIYNSDSILRMGFIPGSMAVVGGGVIGCEYASIFAALGVKVTLIESRDRLLAYADHEIVDRLRTRLDELGVRIVFNESVIAVAVNSSGVDLTLRGGEVLACDIALYAAGRQSNTAGLGLEKLGVNMGERGLIKVNDKYQTTIPNIYAAGDVIGYPALASTSMEQARVAMVHAFDLRYKESVSKILPLAIYTIPEISWVGLTEEACIAQNIPYLVGRAYYENNPRGQIIGDMSGMIKLIFAPEDKKLLGIHHIGEMASELVHIGATSLAAGGTIDAFIQAVYNYPTLADLYKYAAYDGLGHWDRWQEAHNTVQVEPTLAGNKEI